MNRHALLLTFLGSLLTFCVSAQNLDSLLLENKNNYLIKDSVAFDRVHQIANIYLAKGEFRKARPFLDEMIGTALQLGDKFEAFYYTNIVRYYGMQNELDSAAIMLDRAIELNAEIKDTTALAKNHFNLGNILMYKNDLDSAAILYIEALKFFRAKNDKNAELTILNNLSTLFHRNIDLDKSRSYIKKSITLAKTLKDTNSLANAYTNYAINLNAVKPVQFDSILTYQNKALQLYKLVENRMGIARENGNIGSILWKKGKSEKALPYLLKAEEQYLELGKEGLLGKIYLSLGGCYFEFNNFEKSLFYYKKSLPLVQKSNDVIALSQNHTNLAKAAKELNRRDVAIENYQKAIALRDTLEQINNKSILYDVEQKYQTRLKQDSIQILELQTEKQATAIKGRNIGLTFSSILLLLLTALAWLYRRYFNSQKELNALLEKEKEELIFEKQDLVAMNADLETKVATYAQQQKESILADKLELRSTNRIHLIEPQNIRYLKAEEEGSRLHLENEAIWVEHPVKEILNQLPKEQFLTIFRGIVVNLAYIAWVNHASLRMQDGTELKISRTYKATILEKFGK